VARWRFLTQNAEEVRWVEPFVPGPKDQGPWVPFVLGHRTGPYGTVPKGLGLEHLSCTLVLANKDRAGQVQGPGSRSTKPNAFALGGEMECARPPKDPDPSSTPGPWVCGAHLGVLNRALN
jgi:hypothetical protein